MPFAPKFSGFVSLHGFVVSFKNGSSAPTTITITENPDKITMRRNEKKNGPNTQKSVTRKMVSILHSVVVAIIGYTNGNTR